MNTNSSRLGSKSSSYSNSTLIISILNTKCFSYRLSGSLPDADLLGQGGGGWDDYGEAGYHPWD